VRLVLAGQAAGLLALRPTETPDGSLARGAGVQHLLSRRAFGQERVPRARADSPAASLSRLGAARVPPLLAAGDDHVCAQCGAEEALHKRGLCARCVLHSRLTELLGDRPQRVRIGLDALFDALYSARSAKDMLRWLADSPATPVLAGIASGELECSHQALDRQPASGAVRHLEYLLVETGALPVRDPALARLERWIEEFLASHQQPALRTFAHWVVLRRCRKRSQQGPLNMAALSSAKSDLASAAEFLGWLQERETPLQDCRQADVDAWLGGSRPDRHRARSFARWATRRGLMPKLDFPAGPHTGVGAPVLDQDHLELARRLLHDPNITTRDRVAGVLIVLFAQRVGRIARLTIDDVAIDDDTVAIRFGDTAITMPDPLATQLRELIAERRGWVAAAVPETRWLFPGGAPGRPINEQVLSRRLKRIGVDCSHARRTALLQLARQMPAALVADLLGVHIVTATKWAEIAGRPWGEYPEMRAQTGQPRRRPD
jgi:integrase